MHRACHLELAMAWIYREIRFLLCVSATVHRLVRAIVLRIRQRCRISLFRIGFWIAEVFTFSITYLDSAVYEGGVLLFIETTGKIMQYFKRCHLPPSNTQTLALDVWCLQHCLVYGGSSGLHNGKSNE